MINNQGKIMQTCNRNISDVQVDKIDQFYAIDIDSDRIVRIGSSLDVDTVVLPKLSTISRLSPKILLDEIEKQTLYLRRWDHYSAIQRVVWIILNVELSNVCKDDDNIIIWNWNNKNNRIE